VEGAARGEARAGERRKWGLGIISWSQTGPNQFKRGGTDVTKWNL
jgi:hypothetical protein